MKIHKKEVKPLIRIKISDKNNLMNIILCDTTLEEVFNMIEKIVNYNEQFVVRANENTLVTIRESFGHVNGKLKSIRSKFLSVSEINKYILNEVTINN